MKLSFSLRLSLLYFFCVFACMFFHLSSLINWDGAWYRHVVDFGYSATESADPHTQGLGNVGFFPAYPLGTYLVKRILGFGSDLISTDLALVFTANAFAVLMWVYLEKWLGLFSWPQNTSRNRAKMILFALYPYGFFFYCAYTESMFVSMLLGFFYFSERFIREEGEKKSWRFFFLAILHGFLMNATRLVGFVLVLYPLVRALQVKEKKTRAFLIAPASLSSIAFFFTYCHFKFGAWDFYFTSERLIWSTYVDLNKLWPPTELFNFRRPFHADTVSKYVGIGSGLFLSVKLIQLCKEKQWRSPYFIIILCSGMLWGEYILGRTSYNFNGLGRYLIPVFVLILPFLSIQPKWNWKWALIGSVLIGFQIAYALKFGRHGWVA